MTSGCLPRCVAPLDQCDAFFKHVQAAAGAAHGDTLIEASLQLEHPPGKPIHSAQGTVQRPGIRTESIVDGSGSGDLWPSYVAALIVAGARVLEFNPEAELSGMRTNVFRLSHRNVDSTAERLAHCSARAKQNYALGIDNRTVLLRPLPHWWVPHAGRRVPAWTGRLRAPSAREVSLAHLEQDQAG